MAKTKAKIVTAGCKSFDVKHLVKIRAFFEQFLADVERIEAKQRAA